MAQNSSYIFWGVGEVEDGVTNEIIPKCRVYSDEEVYTLYKAYLRVSEMTKQVETVSVQA